MNYRNAKHISEGRIDCEIEHPVHGWIPYTLDPADTDTTVDNGALLLAIGDDAAAYVPPTQEELDVALAASVREERNAALAATDYVSLSDYPVKAGELEYRQALRDVPQQAGFPKTHTWPNKP
jgi:hypothetical protein|tara:strand:+ start:337 stop:705 length:369 start_codon:yes stop_codon:yes gene_type:complete